MRLAAAACRQQPCLSTSATQSVHGPCHDATPPRPQEMERRLCSALDDSRRELEDARVRAMTDGDAETQKQRWEHGLGLFGGGRGGCCG